MAVPCRSAGDKLPAHMSPCLSHPCILPPGTPNPSEFKSPQALAKHHQHSLSFLCHLFQLTNQIDIDQAPIHSPFSTAESQAELSFLSEVLLVVWPISLFFGLLLTQKISISPKLTFTYNIICFYPAVAGSRSNYHMPHHNGRSWCWQLSACLPLPRLPEGNKAQRNGQSCTQEEAHGNVGTMERNEQGAKESVKLDPTPVATKITYLSLAELLKLLGTLGSLLRNIIGWT